MSKSSLPVRSGLAQESLSLSLFYARATLQRLARGWRRWVLSILLIAFILTSLPGDHIPPDERFKYQVRTLTGPYEFSLWAWEARGLAQKAWETVADPSDDIPPGERARIVREYVAAARRIGALEGRIERIYADSSVVDPDAATAPLRSEIARLRELQRGRRPIAEAILQAQISAVLREEGLTLLGQVWPPVKFSFAEPPYYLIISPRARIELYMGVYLQPDLPLNQHVLLESQVESLDNVSALVEGVGGFGAYPTMVIDRASLDWILNTIAHEWTHNYLAFHPLGWHYYDSNDTVTLNETVASIVGDEVGAKALARFYPDLVPPERTPPSQKRPVEPPEFDFGQEMRATRLAVDALLAKGYIDEAEAFMEARRRRFLSYGYAIRRLNQAYFAFHGSYATSPGAVDPIGPKLIRLRELSPSLAAFLRSVARITSVAELDAMLEAHGAAP
ncbi:MAG TPA: hypothetical protein G4O02_03970 [Caldilineae bacterium]|nr:hypothetical protein [Caldilineae bacterium]